jgi:predicted PurR-regulated permease PerM
MPENPSSVLKNAANLNPAAALAARNADLQAAAESSNSADDSDANDWASAAHMRTLVLMAATVIGAYFCYRMAAPFMPAITGAFALAVLFAPMQTWLEVKVKNASLAAAISVFAIAMMVVVPATFVMQHLVLQAAAGAQMVSEKLDSGEWRRNLAAQPTLAPIAAKIERELDLPGAIRGFTNWLTTSAGAVVKGSLIQVIGLTLTFYLLFFFLRDRRTALFSMRALSPMTSNEMSLLFQRVGDTIYATIYGTLAVAGVQGLLGGIMLWCLGVQAALLWGLVMAILAVVPVLGAFIVWIPAAIFLALEGSWGKALILTLWGIFVVGTIDNLLRPMLVGNRLKLHTVLAFLSVVGGLALFGPSGLILGPVVLTITILLLEIWSARAKKSA